MARGPGGSPRARPPRRGCAFSTPSMRYQQIYSHTQFASGGFINAISFRRGSGDPAFLPSSMNVQIDIGYAAIYLASDESGFTTGTTQIIDGGWSA